MNTTINLNSPSDKLNVIVRYDRHTNRIDKIIFFYEDVQQLMIDHHLNTAAIDPLWERHVPSSHVNAAKEMILCFNNQSQDFPPSKLYYDLLINNAILRDLVRTLTQPTAKPEYFQQYMYDYVPYQDIIKAELGEQYPIDKSIGIQSNAPENQTCYMNVLKERPAHARFNMTYDRDMMEHLTPEAIQTLLDHFNKE